MPKTPATRVVPRHWTRRLQAAHRSCPVAGALRPRPYTELGGEQRQRSPAPRRPSL